MPTSDDRSYNLHHVLQMTPNLFCDNKFTLEQLSQHLEHHAVVALKALKKLQKSKVLATDAIRKLTSHKTFVI